MIKPSVKLKGAKVFTNRLNRYVENLQSQLNDMVDYEAKVTFDKSQRDVPVDTGALSKSGRLYRKQKNKILVTSVEYGNNSDVNYGAYKEFGTGKGMNFQGEYGQFELVEYARTFKLKRSKKQVNTRQVKFIFRNAFMSKRNLERKVNTLAKNL